MNSAEYEVTVLYGGQPTPQAVQVSFELPFHGWYRLERLDVWRHLLEVLADFQRE